MSIIGIDVVFPISSVSWLPYVSNACAGVRAQKYPQSHVGIIISYLYSDLEPLGDLAALCRNFDVVLVQRARTQMDAFETPLARNSGARCSSRDAIAFIDSDIVLHPDTFGVAAKFLGDGKAAVIPVADVDHGPEWDVFQRNEEQDLLDAAAQGHHRSDGFGAVIVPSKVVRRLHGYDERMYGWGADDADFAQRVVRGGAPAVSLVNHGCPMALHQRHPTGARESAFTKRNRDLHAGSQSLVRNEHDWGCIPVSAATWQEEPGE